MKVTVKYFGAIAEQAGLHEEAIELSEIGTSLGDLKTHCIQKYQLDDDALQIAINQQIGTVNTLNDGDEIAFLPPFAGG